jgi:pyruvate kinase
MCEDEVNYENMLAARASTCCATRIAEPGQRVVVTAGIPFHVPGTTNMLRVEEL